MLNKIYILIAGMTLAFFAGYKVGKSFTENSCNKEISELKDKEVKASHETIKAIDKTKKISIINNSRDRDELIDRL